MLRVSAASDTHTHTHTHTHQDPGMQHAGHQKLASQLTDDAFCRPASPDILQLQLVQSASGVPASPGAGSASTSASDSSPTRKRTILFINPGFARKLQVITHDQMSPYATACIATKFGGASGGSGRNVYYVDCQASTWGPCDKIHPAGYHLQVRSIAGQG